ncbi:MAG: sugar phosphate isomerase/epimerase, partial [Anaerolineae bacterium]|nr:sugar phosphate isomerase/epimerase [Anaerolineae bacterium]
MQILGRTQPLAKYPVLRALEVIQGLGFDGVEICLENDDMAPDLLTPEKIAAVRQRVTALGLEPISISYHQDYVYSDVYFELTKSAIRVTPEFGTDLFVFSGPPKRANDDEGFDRMVARTRELAVVAERAGVILAEEFEPNFVVGSTADLLRLFEAVDSPALAANMDLGHVFLCDPDPIAAIRAVGKRIVHCHVEGMATGVHNHLLPQEGDMDLAAYLAALHDVGYDGPLSLDLYNHDYEVVAADTIAYLQGLLVSI